MLGASRLQRREVLPPDLRAEKKERIRPLAAQRLKQTAVARASEEATIAAARIERAKADRAINAEFEAQRALIVADVEQRARERRESIEEGGPS